MSTQTAEDRKALKEWESIVREQRLHTHTAGRETTAQRAARMVRLESSFEQWAKYYFPGVCKSEFAKWHKKYAKHLIEAEYDITMVIAMLSRDLAKSSVTALLVLNLYYVKKDFRSLGLFSYNEDQAEGLLAPIKRAIEANQRLINDYGKRAQLGSWTSTAFRTTDGVSFAAFGAGQSPRGEKDADTADRFDFLIFDDFDHPEVCMNPDRLDKNWKYVQGDVFPALHVAGKKRIIALNNKIDEDCIIQRLWDHSKGIKGSLRITVNLVDAEKHSNWPEAYTDEQCAEMIHLAGNEAETEYFNNPVRKGTVFQKDWFHFKKMPPLSKYKILIAYLDGGFKKGKNSDTKALILIGWMNQEYHIRKVYVDNCTIETMVGWHYDLDNFLRAHNATCEYWMEEVFLLGLLHEHFEAAVAKYGFRIPMRGDKRQKPDKDLRISNTAGYFERARVFFDETLKDDPFTKRLIEQYLRFKMGVASKGKDGPDAGEGGIFLINQKNRSFKYEDLNVLRPRKNPKRF